jgi:hypothetical protein
LLSIFEALWLLRRLQYAEISTNMTSFRRHRLITVLLALFSMLFMQLAVARYVCPMVMMDVAEGTQAMAHAGMPCADSMPMAMDDAQAGLCQAHCQADQQSADTYALPDLPMMPAMSHDFAKQSALPIPQGVPLQAPLLQRTTTPPLAVRNCCFRT